jgi:hypothetical protein
MKKKRNSYKISLTYDEVEDELIIDRHNEKILSYCEPFEFNGMEIDFIDVIRNNEGRISKMKIRDYSKKFNAPILEEISMRLEANLKLREILKTSPIFLKYGTN